MHTYVHTQSVLYTIYVSISSNSYLSQMDIMKCMPHIQYVCNVMNVRIVSIGVNVSVMSVYIHARLSCEVFTSIYSIQTYYTYVFIH